MLRCFLNSRWKDGAMPPQDLAFFWSTFIAAERHQIYWTWKSTVENLMFIGVMLQGRSFQTFLGILENREATSWWICWIFCPIPKLWRDDSPPTMHEDVPYHLPKGRRSWDFCGILMGIFRNCGYKELDSTVMSTNGSGIVLDVLGYLDSWLQMLQMCNHSWLSHSFHSWTTRVHKKA